MNINLLLQIDDLAVDLNKDLILLETPKDAVGFMLANTNESSNIKIAIRPRNATLTTPTLQHQNPTASVDPRNNYMQVCLNTMPIYTTPTTITCTDTQSDIAIEIDKSKTYLVSIDDAAYKSVMGHELYQHFVNEATFDTYTDKRYPAYVNEIFCMPTDLGFMYDSIGATNADSGMILRYQVGDAPVRTFATNTNLDLPNVDTAKFFQLFANELTALNLGPRIRLAITPLDTGKTVYSGSTQYNLLANIYTGNMGLLELGQSAGELLGVESTADVATPVTLRLHVYNDTTFNGVGIKGKNGNIKGYVDVYPLLFGTATEFVEVNSCGTATATK